MEPVAARNWRRRRWKWRRRERREGGREGGAEHVDLSLGLGLGHGCVVIHVGAGKQREQGEGGEGGREGWGGDGGDPGVFEEGYGVVSNFLQSLARLGHSQPCDGGEREEEGSGAGTE